MNRSAFEEYAASEGLEVDRCGEGYSNTETHVAWMTWKQAISIERARYARLCGACEALASLRHLWHEDRPENEEEIGMATEQEVIMDADAPELPKADGYGVVGSEQASLYSIAQMYAYARKAALEERERCAVLCDSTAKLLDSVDKSYSRGLKAGMHEAAHAIRNQGNV